MKKLVKPVQADEKTVIAYDNEGCTNVNCACVGSSSGNSSGNTAAWIAAGATVVAACIAAICT